MGQAETGPDSVVSGVEPGQELGWPLGPLELRVLRAVWQQQQATVRSIGAVINRDHAAAYTTIMTVMSRLTDKGLLKRALVGKTHHYTARVTPDEFTALISQRMLSSLVAEFGDLAIAQFAAQLERVDPERLRRLQQAQEGPEF